MENERIKAIHDAAVRLFLQQGYSKTQISHIAGAVGVSVGTIYHDFTGKQEIMHFVLKCTISPEYMTRDWERPITDAPFQGLEDEITQVFEKSAAKFSGHLADGGRDYDFPALISDAFDMLSEYAVGCLFIEKNQFDFPRLAKNYREYRKRFFQTMVDYLKLFMEKGSVRALKNTELTASMIIEILTWWAMDMRYISFEENHVSPEQAKEICMDNILHAYGTWEKN